MIGRLGRYGGMTSEDSESSRRRGKEVKNKSGKCAKFGCDFSRDNMTSDDSHIRDMTRRKHYT